MKKLDTEKTKVFPFKLSNLLLILSILCLALCAAGITVTIIRIVNFGIHGVMDVLKYPLLLAICLLCIAVVISILIRTHYVVGEQTLTTQYGFIKSTYSIQDFTSITVDMQTNKLTIYQGENFFVLTVKAAWQNDFVQAILEVNPSIQVDYTLTENKPPKEENK